MDINEIKNYQQVPERYRQPNAWPHVWAKSSNKRLTKEGEVYQQFCVHCHKNWWPVLEQRPIGRCPARNDERELKRMLG